MSFGIVGALRAMFSSAPSSMRRASSTSPGLLGRRAARGVAGTNRTILGASRIVDDPAERARLHAHTGADAVDMESGALAAAGAWSAAWRAISDTPTHRSVAAEGATADGEVDYLGFLRGFARQPLVTARAAAGARRALKGPGGDRMSKRVLLAAPRSFCAGVDRAIEIVERLLAGTGLPFYVRYEIVHNDHVVRRPRAARRSVRRRRGRDSGG